MNFILGIIWDTGEREIIPYLTMEEASRAELDYKIAFGSQIQYSWVGRK